MDKINRMAIFIIATFVSGIIIRETGLYFMFYLIPLSFAIWAFIEWYKIRYGR